MVPGLAWKSSVRCELALAYGVRRRPSVTQLFVSHVSVQFSRPHAPPSLSLPTVRGGVGLFLGSALRSLDAWVFPSQHRRARGHRRLVGRRGPPYSFLPRFLRFPGSSWSHRNSRLCGSSPEKKPPVFIIISVPSPRGAESTEDPRTRAGTGASTPPPGRNG